jgi:hypothetical protein
VVDVEGHLLAGQIVLNVLLDLCRLTELLVDVGKVLLQVVLNTLQTSKVGL